MYFPQETFSDLLFVWAEGELVKENHQIGDRHRNQIRNGFAPYAYIIGFGAESLASTGIAGSLTTVASKEYAVLYLIVLFLQFFEKGSKPCKVLIAVPYELLLGFGKLVPRAVNREIKLIGIIYQLISEPRHGLPAPRINRVVVYRKRGVGYDEGLIKPYGITITLTHRTSTIRIVEAKQMYIRLQEGNPISFELVGEVAFLS